MPAQRSSILKSKPLNNWWLFALIVVPMCIAVVVSMTSIDLSTSSVVSGMVQLLVRLAVPWLFIAFAASSPAVVFPGPVSQPGGFVRWHGAGRKADVRSAA